MVLYKQAIKIGNPVEDTLFYFIRPKSDESSCKKSDGNYILCKRAFLVFYLGNKLRNAWLHFDTCHA